MSIFLRDSFRPPTGRLSYKVFRKDRVIEEVDDRNLIVVGSQVTHAHLLGGDTANRVVSLFGVGTNGTASVFANATLTGSYVNNLGSPTYPATNEVSFPFSLASTEANGMAIMEFGLFTTGGVLYARNVRALALNKASDISLSGSWIISF